MKATLFFLFPVLAFSLSAKADDSAQLIKWLNGKSIVCTRDANSFSKPSADEIKNAQGLTDVTFKAGDNNYVVIKDYDQTVFDDDRLDVEISKSWIVLTAAGDPPTMTYYHIPYQVDAKGNLEVWSGVLNQAGDNNIVTMAIDCEVK